MADPVFDNVVLQLLFEGADGSTTFTDTSNSAHTVTPVGDAQIDTAVYKFGTSSALFDGTGDRLEVAESTDFDFGSGDWCVRGWVRCNSTTGNDLIAAYAPSGGAAAWFLRREGTAWRFQIYTGSAFYGNSTFGTAAADTWYHVAFCRDGNNLRRFVDGVGATPIDITGLSLATLSSPTLQIGSVYASDPLDGWLGNLEIIKGEPVYTADFTPPTDHPPGAPGGVEAYGSDPGPLGAPTAYSFTVFAHASAASMLGAPSVLGLHDFTGAIGDSLTTYVMDLETPSGLVRVPISSWQATLQTDGACYAQCVVPACTDWVADITASTEFVISRRVTLADGRTVEYEMARAPTAAAFDRGSYNYTATLSGYMDAFAADEDPPTAFDRVMTGIRTISISSTGLKRCRCAIDWLLRPAQRAYIDGDPIICAYVNYYVGVNDAYMDVGER